MAKVIEGLYYSKEHEWVKVDGENAIIGITDYAQNSLGEIVYVEVPELEEEVEAGEAFTEVESVKAASEIYSPLSGEIVEVNEELEDSPQNLNETPYESSIVVIKMSDKSELENLMSASEYKEFCEE